MRDVNSNAAILHEVLIENDNLQRKQLETEMRVANLETALQMLSNENTVLRARLREVTGDVRL